MQLVGGSGSPVPPPTSSGEPSPPWQVRLEKTQEVILGQVQAEDARQSARQRLRYKTPILLESMSSPTEDHFLGCLLGLALGDALGAPREGGPIERLLWRAIGKTRDGKMRWTDDTQMSLDLAESLIASGSFDADDVALRFAGSYLWSRGYGPGAAKLLKRIRRGTPWQDANRSIFRDGSFGNGGAMRAPVVGLFYASNEDALLAAARDSARITHAHPLGLEGAVLMASAVAAASHQADPQAIFTRAAAHCRERPFLDRLAIARAWLSSAESHEPAEVTRCLGNGIAATDSCVTALFLGVRFCARPFADMLGFVAKCGGDVDTIGAMAGAIWGAANGAHGLPAQSLDALEQRPRIEATAKALFERSTATE
jgi:ADP-ribosylglycohydrolase